MCRSARRRGSAHQAHPGNHGHWDHMGEGDGRGLLRTEHAPDEEDSRVGETRKKRTHINAFEEADTVNECSAALTHRRGGARC
ncbi:unnamed protein product [Boreogadus saida]